MTRHTLDDLLYLMQRLRDPDTGCPWDLKQDFASILPHTLEEAYEVADAIERQDWPHLEEELGDLLFQVVFYGQLGDEQRQFDMKSIIDRLVKKLVRRHPHVFPEGTLSSSRSANEVLTDDEINRRWEEIKRSEKVSSDNDQYSTATSTSSAETVELLADVPLGFPAHVRAYKLQKKVASVGFDWPSAQGVLAKIHEELEEVEAEVAAGNKAALTDEIGDLLFAVINLARHHGIHPEVALRSTNKKFIDRFTLVEQRAQQKGGWALMNLESMDQAWDEAKRILKEKDKKKANT